MSTKVVIVEDERMALEYEVTVVSQYQELNICAIFRNGSDAKEYLNKHDIDLLILDMQLPDMKGFEMLQDVKKAQKVIVVTAYKDFAAESFAIEKHQIIDYILKPFQPERFEKSLQKYRDVVKVEQLKTNVDKLFKDGSTLEPDSMLIKQMEYAVRDKGSNYTILHFDGTTHRSRESLSRLLEICPAFVQVSKDTIVNTKKAGYLSQKNAFKIKDNLFEVSKAYPLPEWFLAKNKS